MGKLPQIRWGARGNVEEEAMGGSLAERLERYVPRADRSSFDRPTRRRSGWEIVFTGVSR
jgi:hypothetical protein